MKVFLFVRTVLFLDPILVSRLKLKLQNETQMVMQSPKRRKLLNSKKNITEHNASSPMNASSDEVTDMDSSVRAVEKLLNYTFRDKKLLEDALTHPSYANSASYQRLEFVGDAAIGLAISSHVFLQYPNSHPGKLSIVRAANISTERLARVAVKHKLYKYVRHNASALDEKVRDFVIAVQKEDVSEVYGGDVKAPKVLADIVESIAAAVFIDCNFDMKDMWAVLRHLLDPIVMLDMLEQQPQPVTMLFELCQREGKQVDIKHWRNGNENVATVFVDGSFVVSASSDQKESAKLHAAKAALEKLSYDSGNVMNPDVLGVMNEDGEIEGAKQKLHELCHKKRLKPNYKIEELIGCQAHEKRYISSVEIETADGKLFVKGKEKPRKKEAANSAASAMICALRDSKYI